MRNIPYTKLLAPNKKGARVKHWLHVSLLCALPEQGHTPVPWARLPVSVQNQLCAYRVLLLMYICRISPHLRSDSTLIPSHHSFVMHPQACGGCQRLGRPCRHCQVRVCVGGGAAGSQEQQVESSAGYTYRQGCSVCAHGQGAGALCCACLVPHGLHTPQVNVWTCF